jgi:hypothetical protein
MSTIHLLSFVNEPEAVAWEAVEGRMMCKRVWPDILTFVACEKLGFRMGPCSGLDNSSL